MKLPSLAQAADALKALATMTGHGAEAEAAAGVVGIVIDLFDGKPADQDHLKETYAAAMARTDAALDNVEKAIDSAEGKG